MRKLSITAAIRQATADHFPVVKVPGGWTFTRGFNGKNFNQAHQYPTRAAALRNRRASIAADAARLTGRDGYSAWLDVREEGSTIRQAVTSAPIDKEWSL